MQNISLEIPVNASLGKRKVESLSGLPECKLSITICPSAVKGLHANCWLRDGEGRVLGLTIDSYSLLQLAEKIHAAEISQVAMEKRNAKF